MPLQPLSPVSYEPIRALRTSAGGSSFPVMYRTDEAATQTFKVGTPVMLSSGNVAEITYGGANIIYGVSYEPAHNLTTAGTAQDLSEGAPQNQPLAITTPIGAWPRDGKCGIYAANGQTTWSIALKVGQVFTQALLVAGTLYGIVKDSTSGFWYLDNTVTSGNNAVAELLDFDDTCPNSATYGCRVFFQIAAAKRYFQ
jgi:hypothetical protein